MSLIETRSFRKEMALMSKKLSFAVAVVAAILITSGVAPAQAVSAAHPVLPTTDSLYAIPCGGPDPILESLNTVDSSFTEVGVSHEIDGSKCAYQPAFNPVTGKSYFLAGNLPGGIWVLVEVSTSDGAMVGIGTINSGGTDNVANPGSLIITNDGVSYFIGGGILYPLNLTDASLGSPLNVSDMNPDDDIYGAACSPVAAKCYVLTEGGDLFELDVANGTLEPSGSLNNGSFANYSLQVDSKGTLWSSSNSALASFEASDPSGTYFQGPAFPIYSGALLLTTKKDLLPDTGLSSVNMILLVGAVLVVLVGSSVLMTARRRRI
jgi:LPXTG-motif cell wall-anchored protein